MVGIADAADFRERKSLSADVYKRQEVGFIWEATLNCGDSSEKIYQYISRCQLVAFLAAARYCVSPPKNFSYNNDWRSERFFKNDTYKKEAGNEKD